MRHLVEKFGTAAEGGVAIYQMDNEPSGWDNTHRDVHPAQTGWDELVYPTTPTGVGCIALCEEGDGATQAARLESTRSLWDPTYVEDDWIGQNYGDIDLIPRMQSWVNQYYPGTKTAITEYNFGALDSMNGALAEADALGIFGAQGLGMADLWSPPAAGQPGAFAFQMYRNDDGLGSGFGSISVQAKRSDQSQLSVYAGLLSRRLHHPPRSSCLGAVRARAP